MAKTLTHAHLTAAVAALQKELNKIGAALVSLVKGAAKKVTKTKKATAKKAGAKRGRPAKAKTAKATTAKRGRPAKAKTAKATTAKRGRPAATKAKKASKPAAAGAKRGRGRPRKSAA